jgi:peptidoglycan/LPS O-acetylase OafA/YrhL
VHEAGIAPSLGAEYGEFMDALPMKSSVVPPATSTPAGAAGAPDGQRLPRLGGHMPALDGVRGLAILMVLVLHFVGNSTPTTRVEAVVVWAANYGAYGVDLFFVLSGFLITGILYDARSKPGFFKNFYMRRVLRIFPLYYLVLVVLFLVVPLVPWFANSGGLAEIRAHQAWVWLYGLNIFDGIRGRYSMPYIDHFWSLSVEEHFYFFWPLLVYALARRPRWLMATSLVLGLTALVGRVVASVAGVSPVTIFVLTPFRLDGLAIGGFLAVLARQPGGPQAIMRWNPRIAALAGGALLSSFVWNRFTPLGAEWMRPVRGSLILVLLAAMLLWALTAEPRAMVARVFTSRGMTFFGVYSYGLYVYHHFFSYYFMTHGTEFTLAGMLGARHGLAVGVQAALGSVASILVAYASYHLFEKHFLVLKKLWSSER